jgi:endoglucanase
MPITTSYFVDAQTLAITFEVGDKTSEGKIVDFSAAAGMVDTGWNIVRSGSMTGPDIGFLVGPNKDKVYMFDTFVEDGNAAFFAPINSVAGSAPVSSESSYTITVGGVTYTPSEIFQKTTILESANTSVVWPEFIEKHTIHIKLNAPLTEGQSVSVAFNGSTLPPVTTAYTPDAIRSEAVHVSQIGFDPQDPLKVAFLSTWLGIDHGNAAADASVSYAAGKAFHVVNAATGAEVYSGIVELSQAKDNPSNFAINFSQTDVYKMDFSTITAAGTYHVVVDGVGKSTDFTIGENVWQGAFETVARGMYHQRSGIALESEFTEWTRPRDHHPDDGFVATQSTATLMDTSMGLYLKSQDTFQALVAGDTGVVVENAWGGWFDAADFDRRIQHTESINDMLFLAESKPDLVKNTSLNIPESGNNIPDVIDEALWGVDFFMRLQRTDGAVSGGIEFNTHPNRYETSWTDTNKAYVYAPDAWSSFKFAASAAKAAFAVAPYDQARSAAYVQAAIKALAWADANTPDYAAGNIELTMPRNLACAELYRVTGDEKWNQEYLRTTMYGKKDWLNWNEHAIDAAYTYAKTTHAGVDKTVQDLGIKDIISEAKLIQGFQSDDGFMTPVNPWAPVNWTSFLTSPQNAAKTYTRAHALTGDAQWHEAMIGAVQYTLGANPMNVSYITGVGTNQLREIQDLDGDGMGMAPRPGIPVYGNINVKENTQGAWWGNLTGSSIPDQFNNPVNETYIGWEMITVLGEYTVQQSISPMALLLGYLAGTDADGSKGGNGGTLTPTPTPPPVVTPPVKPPVVTPPVVTPPVKPPVVTPPVVTPPVEPPPVKPPVVTPPVVTPPVEPPKVEPPVVKPPVVKPPVVKPPVDEVLKLLKGSASHDTIEGSDRSEHIKSGNGNDTVTAGAGNDKVELGAGNDRADGEAGNDTILGGNGVDQLYGGAGKDTISGEADADSIYGGSDNDILSGGKGRDVIAGEAGSDTLSGGKGADWFFFMKKAEAGDFIKDFEKGDKIVVRGDDFDLGKGALKKQFFSSGNDNTANDADDHFIWDADSHQLWYDSNGNADGGAVLLATLQNHHRLVASDILVV